MYYTVCSYECDVHYIGGRRVRWGATVCVCGGRAWWGWYYVVGVVGSGGDCMWWGWYMWWGWGWVVPRGRVLLHLVLDPHGRLWGSDALVVEGEGWIEGWIEGDY